MNIPIHYQPSPWRYLWLLLLIGLPILGWHGVLDDFSSQDINHSITNAGLIYGTARGINALVSVLQGTEVNVLVMTFSIGEVLDPVNDLIERFSERQRLLRASACSSATADCSRQRCAYLLRSRFCASHLAWLSSPTVGSIPYSWMKRINSAISPWRISRVICANWIRCPERKMRPGLY